MPKKRPSDRIEIMPKQIIRDVYGELLEIGKQTVKHSKKAVKSVMGLDADDSQELNQQMYGSGENKPGKMIDDKNSKPDDLSRLANLDKSRSSQLYKEIQERIALERRRKKSQPRKYESGKDDFDEEQVKDPESFFDKLKKKKEVAKKGMGTGELARGVSG